MAAIFGYDKEKLCNIILGLAWILEVSLDSYIPISFLYLEFKKVAPERTAQVMPHADFIWHPHRSLGPCAYAHRLHIGRL